MSTLQNDISKKVRMLQGLASTNHAISYGLALSAAFASIVASVSAAVDNLLHPFALSFIAAIPAAALIIQNSIKFQERAIWQFNKGYRLQDLIYQLEEGKPAEAVRIQLLEINREMLDEFPGFKISQIQDSKNEDDIGK